MTFAFVFLTSVIGTWIDNSDFLIKEGVAIYRETRARKEKVAPFMEKVNGHD